MEIIREAGFYIYGVPEPASALLPPGATGYQHQQARGLTDLAKKLRQWLQLMAGTTSAAIGDIGVRPMLVSSRRLRRFALPPAKT